MPPPLASNPHRFHEDRSEIAHDIAKLVRVIAPRRRPPRINVEISAERAALRDPRRGRVTAIS
jgi:hypothetical protein